MIRISPRYSLRTTKAPRFDELVAHSRSARLRPAVRSGRAGTQRSTTSTDALGSTGCLSATSSFLRAPVRAKPADTARYETARRKVGQWSIFSTDLHVDQWSTSQPACLSSSTEPRAYRARRYEKQRMQDTTDEAVHQAPLNLHGSARCASLEYALGTVATCFF